MGCNEATRLVTLRNLGWEPVVRRLKLDASIGFTADGPVEVRQFHPGERILGTFKRGDEVAVEVLPFRSCLLLVDAKQTGGVGLRGCDYEVVRDVPRKDVVIRMLGQAGETSGVSLVSNGRAFRRATIDGQPMAELTTGKTVRIQCSGKPDSAPWQRRIGAPTVCTIPADAEALFESSCFAGDNDPLEIRGFSEGKELDRGGWRPSWLFPRFHKVCQAWSLPFSLDAAAPGSYLTVACNGVHGREGAWVALRVDGRWVGAPQRAPSYPVNPWEYPVSQTDCSYSYFIPVTPDMWGKACEAVVLAFDPKNLEFTPDVWLTAYPAPYQVMTLTLSE